MSSKSIQLNAGCPPGQSQPLFQFNPDGTSTLFSIPSGMTFNLTDISIAIAQPPSATPMEILVGLQQTIPGGQAQRWNFAGYTAENIERSFTTPIAFSKNFEVGNLGPAYLNVNLFGYLS
jgi:hypothetical protein